MELHPGLVFIGGLVVILLGAELLLRSATRLAQVLGVSPLLIGLTVVSVGTSTPELAVGVLAAAEGKGPLAVGNIAGTNLVNILLILGLSAALRPLPIRLQSVRVDVPAMILSALALLAMSLDGQLSRAEGSVLLLGAMGYTLALLHISRRESSHVRSEYANAMPQGAPLDARAALGQVVVLLLAIALTVLGAELLVSGASALARRFGVSDAFIGLTIVAIGTSAPELATTVMATLKDDRDVAMGNLIGSSTYNILAILGLTLLATPGGVAVGTEVLWIDLPLAALVALVCWPVFRSGQQISRHEGLAFVATYLIYLSSLLLWRS